MMYLYKRQQIQVKSLKMLRAKAGLLGLITADVGGNLSIESLQDTKTYVGESSNKGFSVSTNAGSLSNVSMSSSKGKMKSDYASVTD